MSHFENAPEMRTAVIEAVLQAVGADFAVVIVGSHDGQHWSSIGAKVKAENRAHFDACLAKILHQSAEDIERGNYQSQMCPNPGSGNA